MIRLVLWSLAAIFLVDIAINSIFKEPINNIQPSKLTRYFDYGRSVESKLFRLVGTDDTNAANITKAGWFLSDNKLVEENSRRQIYIYGMSFSNHIGEIISQQDKTFDVKMFAGPGAPLNHSYTYYQRHRPHQKGDIVILGILASSIPRMNTLTHMTKSFESPAAHFYPRYRLDMNDKLIKKQISIDSLSELRLAMYDETRWREVKKILEQEDSFYDPIIFSRNVTDKSAYARLLKRAWAQKHTLEIIQHYHYKNGFKNTDRLIDVSQRLVSDFAKQVRKDGAIPFVILFNNRDFGDHLYVMLKPTLELNSIPYYSTHRDFPAEDLSNFIPDGHFTPAVDDKIAQSILKAISSL